LHYVARLGSPALRNDLLDDRQVTRVPGLRDDVQISVGLAESSIEDR